METRGFFAKGLYGGIRGFGFYERCRMCLSSSSALSSATIKLSGTTVDGQCLFIQIPLNADASMAKEKFAEALSGADASEIQLLHGTTVLANHMILAEQGVEANAQLTVLLERRILLKDLQPVKANGSHILPHHNGQFEDSQEYWFSLKEPKKRPQEACLGGSMYRGRSGFKGNFCTVQLSKKENSASGKEGLKAKLKLAERLRNNPHQYCQKLFDAHLASEGDFMVHVLEYLQDPLAIGSLQEAIQLGCTNARENKNDYSAPRLSFTWINHVLGGLEHLHFTADVLFLNLNPANVLVNADGIAKLSDIVLFGRQGVKQDGKWETSYPPGTPGYIAPCILAKEPYSLNADIYSLGVLIWVTLSGGEKLSGAPPRSPLVGTPEDNPGYYRQMLNDCQLIADCIEKDSPPLPSRGAGDLVSCLTRKVPGLRPSHKWITQALSQSFKAVSASRTPLSPSSPKKPKK